MHAKNNRVNKNFQIAYFLAGSCHTADGAYSLLKDLQEEREMALAQLESSELRKQAKMLMAQQMIDSGDPVAALEGEANLAEIRNNQKFADRNIEAAKKELEFINLCIDKLQPVRKFKDLPDPEAHEAAQYDEWKLELISRAENYLLTSGNIPTDHFVTMRQHPAFLTDIVPAIEKTKNMMMEYNNHGKLIEELQKNKLDLPKLLLE